MDIDELVLLARGYHQEGKLEQAENLYKEILKIQSNNAGAHFELANLLDKKGLFEEAILHYQKSIEFDCNFAGSHYNLANIFKRKNQFYEAIRYFLKAIELDRNFSNSYYNLGEILQELGRFDEAIICYQKALHLNPKTVNGWIKLGDAFLYKKQPNEAFAYYKEAIMLDPDNAFAVSGLELAIVASGNYRLWFREVYEKYILKLKKENSKELQYLWDGYDISGKTILIHSDEWSCGDIIQHIRYVPLVAERGARVFYKCRTELKTLLQNVSGLHKIISQDEFLDTTKQLPSFNVHCPLGILPYIFIKNIPAEIPYIPVSTSLIKKWNDTICRDNSRHKVGLVWAGATQGNYSLNIYAPFAQLDNITFYSLQIGKASEEAKSPPERMILFDYTPEINDFLDTAALIENLDLVISVDTSVAHLAGALGKPVWTLIPFIPSWRWMLNGDDSPWYPTMRLFRQPSPGDWNSVMAKVVEELQKFISSKT